LRGEQFRTFGNNPNKTTFDARELPHPCGGANEDRLKPVPHCRIARKNLALNLRKFVTGRKTARTKSYRAPQTALCATG
jgi:hypothetical protein